MIFALPRPADEIEEFIVGHSEPWFQPQVCPQFSVDNISVWCVACDPIDYRDSRRRLRRVLWSMVKAGRLYEDLSCPCSCSCTSAHRLHT